MLFGENEVFINRTFRSLSLELKYIPTTHTHTQASSVGKLPNRSPWGVPTPAEHLLHCASPGPFPSHVTPSPGGPAPKARALLICEWPSRVHTWCPWLLTRACAHSFPPRSCSRLTPALLQPRPSPRSAAPLPSASSPPLSGPRAKNNCVL